MDLEKHLKGRMGLRFARRGIKRTCGKPLSDHIFLKGSTQLSDGGGEAAGGGQCSHTNTEKRPEPGRRNIVSQEEQLHDNEQVVGNQDLLLFSI